ncbi:MAG TPA: VOC family protein [Dongiaceae bacterium]|nr:VOC family protein [Dongiaceae bacterium]
MLSHVYIGVNDFDRAYRFYTAVTAELGLVLRFAQPEKSWAGWQKPGQSRPLLLVGRPFDGTPASPGNGQMTALTAPDRVAVDRAYQAALAAGGSDEGAPGLRPHYHANYYGAYFRDPEGNKLCVVCHDAQD